MKQKFPALVGILLAAFALWMGCKQPTRFGSELLDDELADYEYTDTVTVRCTIEREDSSLTSDRSSTAEYFLCGELNDPEFGKSASDIYALMLGETLNPNFDTTKQKFDSIVLYLAYAPAGFYGDTTQPQTLRVLRLDVGQELGPSKDYYSTQSLAASEEIGSVTNFLPKPNVKDSLFEGIKGAFLRVKLSDSFGQELLSLDSNSYSVDSFFTKKLRGLKIVSSANGASPGAMMAFNLNSTSLSRMRIYYTQDDTLSQNFDFFFGGTNKFTHFQHDHSGSPVGPLIGQPFAAEQKLYVQGMHGVRVKIEFPYANLLDRIAVNQAQLILTVADETPALPPVSQLVLTQYLDTAFYFTSDALYSLNSNFTTFGGKPKKVVDGGNNVTRYRLTLSELFQHIVDDDASSDTKNRTVYLGVYPRSRTAARSVLYGPKSAIFPAKLELIYTKVK